MNRHRNLSQPIQFNYRESECLKIKCIVIFEQVSAVLRIDLSKIDLL